MYTLLRVEPAFVGQAGNECSGQGRADAEASGARSAKVGQTPKKNGGADSA